MWKRAYCSLSLRRWRRTSCFADSADSVVVPDDKRLAYEVVVARELEIGSTEDVELTTAAVVEARSSVLAIGVLDAVRAIGEELELAAISELAAAMALDEDARGAELATRTAELEESMCEALELVATSALVATDDVAATAELTDAVDDATALYITGVSSVRRS